MAGPGFPSSDGRAKTLLLFAGGLVVTLAIVIALVSWWPSDDDGEVVADATSATVAGDTTTTGAGTVGEPSERTSTTEAAPEPVELFESGADDAVADMVAAAGDPDQAIQVSVYPTYAFLAYRSPANPDHIDRRSWRDGQDQDDGGPNPIDDRVNADTEPSLFPISGIDLSLLPQLIDDAPSRFDLDVEVTHVLIDRFLPFDSRVLIRVYASPTDGRRGGGYVQYTTDGTFMKAI